MLKIVGAKYHHERKTKKIPRPFIIWNYITIMDHFMEEEVEIEEKEAD